VHCCCYVISIGAIFATPQVIEKIRNKLRVRYDNGDEEDVHVDHVSEFESLPFDFGEEADLRVGSKISWQFFLQTLILPTTWVGDKKLNTDLT
jgi:hypothetical protein